VVLTLTTTTTKDKTPSTDTGWDGDVVVADIIEVVLMAQEADAILMALLTTLLTAMKASITTLHPLRQSTNIPALQATKAHHRLPGDMIITLLHHTVLTVPTLPLHTMVPVVTMVLGLTTALVLTIASLTAHTALAVGLDVAGAVDMPVVMASVARTPWVSGLVL